VGDVDLEAFVLRDGRREGVQDVLEGGQGTFAQFVA